LPATILVRAEVACDHATPDGVRSKPDAQGRACLPTANAMRSAARCLVLAVAVLLTSGATRLFAQEKPKKPVDDGWPDLSSFLKEKYGFLPIVVPITEPAVGYGAAGGVAFLSKSLGQAQAGFGRPDITKV